MVKISKLEIKNYRSCLDTKLNLDNNLTALIGINGVGKSNILNGIKLLKNSANQNRHYSSSRNFGEHVSTSEIRFKLTILKKNIDLKAKFFYETDEKNVDQIYYSSLFYKLPEKLNWTEIRYSPYSFRVIQRIRPPAYYLSKNDELNKIEFKICEYLYQISYYGATQFSDPSKCPVSIELEDSRPTLRSVNFEKTHDKFIHDLYLTSRNRKTVFEKYLNTVNKKGIGIVDTITFTKVKLPSSSYTVKIGGKLRETEKTKNIVIPSITIDGLSLSPNQLSEGTFKTLALVFYILNDQSNLLLIEEPEVCVHHGLLNSIVGLIKSQSKNKQIIISTHSDYLLDMLSPESILLVKKDTKTGTVAKPLNKVMSKNDFTVLKQYLKNSGNLGEYWKEGGFENE